MGAADIDNGADAVGIEYAGPELACAMGNPFDYADLAKIAQDV